MYVLFVMNKIKKLNKIFFFNQILCATDIVNYLKYLVDILSLTYILYDTDKHVWTNFALVRNIIIKNNF